MAKGQGDLTVSTGFEFLATSFFQMALETSTVKGDPNGFQMVIFFKQLRKSLSGWGFRSQIYYSLRRLRLSLQPNPRL